MNKWDGNIALFTNILCNTKIVTTLDGNITTETFCIISSCMFWKKREGQMMTEYILNWTIHLVLNGSTWQDPELCRLITLGFSLVSKPFVFSKPLKFKHSSLFNGNQIPSVCDNLKVIIMGFKSVQPAGHAAAALLPRSISWWNEGSLAPLSVHRRKYYPHLPGNLGVWRTPESHDQ